MKKIIDYLFYRYYLISIKNEEFPRFGATCVLAEVVTMVYLLKTVDIRSPKTGISVHFSYSLPMAMQIY